MNISSQHQSEKISPSKRSRPDEASSSMDVDDLVSMISSKLEHLETCDSIDTLISVFVEVLKCTAEEAAFFLDSASNDLATAVSLYFEAQNFTGRSRPNDSSAPQHLPPTMLEFDPSLRRYRQMTLSIHGLPVEWEATVCPITGVVMFEHIPTGIKQNQVPPGFADALPSSFPTHSSNSLALPESEPESSNMPFLSVASVFDEYESMKDERGSDDGMEEQEQEQEEQEQDVFSEGL